MAPKEIQLGEVLNFEQPTRYLVHSSDYTGGKADTPVLTAGKTFILGYSKEKDGVFDRELPVILFDDFTTASKMISFPFKVKSSAAKILYNDKKETDIRYLYYIMQGIRFPVRKHKRHWISEYSKLVIPLPSLDEQKRIADKLDEAMTQVQTVEGVFKNTTVKSKALFGSYIRDKFATSKLEQTKLGVLCDIAGGTGFPHSHQGRRNEKYPFYKVSDMNLEGNEVYMKTHNNSISDEDVKKLKAKIYPAGSIIFPKIGAAIATNKKRILSAPSTVDNNVMVLVPKEGVLSEYIYTFLLDFNLSDWASKSSLPSIRKSEVEEAQVPIPVVRGGYDVAEQERFARDTKTVRDKVVRIRQLADDSLQKLSALKQSLLSGAFTMTT